MAKMLAPKSAEAFVGGGTIGIPARPFGSTGLNISPLGFGTVKIGRNSNVKNACGDGFELPSDKKVLTILDSCIELGINLLDTAPAYGISEERLGELLQNRRDKFILITKTGEDFINGKSIYNFSYEHTIKSVERSLKRLKTDVLEGVLVHCDQTEMEILQQGECLKALEKLKSRGDIKSYGWSSRSLQGGLKALELTDMVMVSANPTYTAELEVVTKAAELNKGILLKKALLQGHLDKLGNSRSTGSTGSTVSADPIQECMNFAANLAGNVCVVAGTLNLQHLRSNAEKMARVLGSQNLAIKVAKSWE